MDCKTHPAFFMCKSFKRIVKEDKTTIVCNKCGVKLDPSVFEEGETICCGEGTHYAKMWVEKRILCGKIK